MLSWLRGRAEGPGRRDKYGRAEGPGGRDRYGRQSGEPSSEERWLVVGLGNPGSEYGGTRHNVGAQAVRALGARLGLPLTPNKRVRCEVAEARDGEVRLVLAVPMSYMNDSGGPVRQAASWYKIPPRRIVVLHDELDLEVATVRLKLGGGTAGHRGLDDLVRSLGTRDFARVRIGVGRPPGRSEAADHVLRRFSSREQAEIDVALQEAADAVLGLVHEGLEPTQNRIHRRR
ncbi:MAG: aminoacyl-tRNA hydrolase [Actinomycetota bacterium]|nr:aminoacyl-tRNA hydrolase [Actinomycetota bacterium]